MLIISTASFIEHPILFNLGFRMISFFDVIPHYHHLMNMFQGDYSRVTFRVECPVAPGQIVAISGDVSGLGYFRQSSVVELVTTPSEYPIWKSASPVIVPTNQLMQYKYCIMEGGSFLYYENCEKNRILNPTEFDVIVNDSFFSPAPPSNTNEVDDLVANYTSVIERGTAKTPLEAIAANNRLYLVCYHLPVSISRSNDPTVMFEVNWTDSILAKSENSVAQSLETLWIGTPQLDSIVPSITESERKVLTEILKKINCIPVYIEHSVAIGHYQGFCKQILWPLFHNVDQLDTIHSVWKLTLKRVNKANSLTAHTGNNAQVDEEIKWINDNYVYYQEVNRIYAELIRSMLAPNDVIWVHDYHLMLLPKLLRDSPEYLNISNMAAADTSIDSVKIIFFLHIPFPTSQIFRTLSQGQELLKSLTYADVIGFHAFDYTRHFLNAAKRTLGIKSRTRPGGLLSLIVADREVSLIYILITLWQMMFN